LGFLQRSNDQEKKSFECKSIPASSGSDYRLVLFFAISFQFSDHLSELNFSNRTQGGVVLSPWGPNHRLEQRTFLGHPLDCKPMPGIISREMISNDFCEMEIPQQQNANATDGGSSCH
jgi:hypothetical protein